MDIEDEGWVNIPYDGLLEIDDDDEGKKFFSRKFVPSPRKLFKLDYFNSSQKTLEFADSSMITFPTLMNDNQVVDREEDVKELTHLPILINNELVEAPESDLDPIFQVFFKKENEFVEMKMDSPRSNSWRTTLPCIETDKFQYEDKSDKHIFDCLSPSKDVNDEEVDKVIKEDDNILKKGLNGIGVFCSLGMAAATICIILFGNSHRHKQNQRLRIQLYSDDKRINHVVNHAVRGVPFKTANITYGGFYAGF